MGVALSESRFGVALVGGWRDDLGVRSRVYPKMSD